MNKQKRNEKQQKADNKNLELAHLARKRKRIIKKCVCCGVLKSMPLSVFNRGWKFCSNKCRYIFKRGENGPNAGGGQWMKGSNNPNYKDGTGYKRHERYRQDKVQQWRRRIYARDNFTCQKCNFIPKKANSLNAHHIKSWKEHPNKRFNISNGITLCKECHKKEHYIK